jgi:hypothetical protein
MASPHLSSAHHADVSSRRYRRSAFNGAKQLTAAEATSRRVLLLVGLLGLALAGALAVVVFHLVSGQAS